MHPPVSRHRAPRWCTRLSCVPNTRFGGPRALRSSISRTSAAGKLGKGSPQGSEPGLEVTPLVEPLPVNRLADLLGTCRADTALGLVELEARRLKVEPDEVQNPSNLMLEVVDQLLVLHAQDSARQDRVPVGHDLDVGAVVAPEVLEAVSELLPRRKQLFEVAEAAGERLAAGLDDPRLP